MPRGFATKMAAHSKKVLGAKQLTPSFTYQEDPARYPENPDFDKLLASLVEPCEVIANVQFSKHESGVVAILDKATLKLLQCKAPSFKIMLQKDLIKKGITSVPIFEYGCNTRELLGKQPKFKLTAEDDKKAKKVQKEAKQLEDEPESED